MRDSLRTRTRFLWKWRHVNISTLTKWMYRISTIWNLLNSLRTFFHKWLKWRRYSPFAYMLFCKLTPLDLWRVHTIVFYQKSEFRKWITSLHIQHWIYVREFKFFVFTMKKITSTFCNVSFAVQYMIGKIRPSLLFLQDNLTVWIKTIISLIIFFFLYYKWHFGVVEHNIRNFQKSDFDPILFMDTCRIRFTHPIRLRYA